jgi:hypothetical protein
MDEFAADVLFRVAMRTVVVVDGKPILPIAADLPADEFTWDPVNLNDQLADAEPKV